MRSLQAPPVAPEALASVQGWLEDNLGGTLSEAAAARLRDNLAVLQRAGITAPQQVHQWANARHVHDYRLACFAGPITQLGYLVGMELAQNVLANRMPRHVLSDASRTGAVLGTIVGALDVGTTVLGAELMRRLAHAGSIEDMPKGVRHTSMADAVLRDTLWATGLNLAKNISRAVLPFVQRQIENRPDGLITRQWCDLADVSWDGGMGLATGLVDTLRKMHQGGDGIPYLARLMLQPTIDFAGLVDRTHRQAAPMPALTAVARTAAERPAARRGTLASAIPALVVPLSVLGIVIVHVSMLVSRNANLIQAGHQGRNLPEGLADPRVMSTRGLSSTHQMALMTATISLLAPFLAVAAGKLADFATDPKLPPGVALRWPSFLRSQLPPPAGTSPASP